LLFLFGFKPFLLIAKYSRKILYVIDSKTVLVDKVKEVKAIVRTALLQLGWET